MNIIEYSNKGKRLSNQDYVIHRSFSDQTAVCVLTDGMGGYSHGEIASRLVADTVVDYIEKNIEGTDPTQLLQRAIYQSDEALMLKKVELGIHKIGTVITVLLIKEDTAYLSWLGDSRIYMFRNGVEVFRTKDHSYLNEIPSIEMLTVDSIDRFSSMVTRSVMGENNLGEIPVRYVKIMPGDQFILCSDGVHKELDLDVIKHFSESSRLKLDNYSQSINDNYSFIKIDL